MVVECAMFVPVTNVHNALVMHVYIVGGRMVNLDYALSTLLEMLGSV